MTLIEQLEANLVTLRAQRMKIATGEVVTEVWRDGRRMKLEVATPEQLEKIIEAVQRELAEAQAAAGITPTTGRRRRAIGIRYR